MPADKGKILISIARATISEALGQANESIEDIAQDKLWLQEKAACFVTLTQNQQLRGCIGTLEAYRSLLEDVTHNANAAAFHDTRFSPLRSEELKITEIEVSLLSAMQPLSFSSEQEALAQLRPGIDGVLFEFDQHRSTFLPQVWQQLPTSKEFIEHLKIKAGLSADFWSDNVRLSRYSVDKWQESDFKKSHAEQTL